MGKLKLTPEDREWATKVKSRDDWSCWICGSKERLNAHHIIPRENKATKFLLLNGACLCPNHHMFSRQISAHNNPLAFFKWMHEHRPDTLNALMEMV